MVKGERNIEYNKNGIIIELHHHFSSAGFDMDDILEKAIQRRVYRELSGYRFPMLPDVENGLVLLGHINQHLKGNDLGLRQIIDWEIYFYSVMNKVVWREFTAIIKNIGLLQLTVNVIQMCEKHLGLPNRINWKNKNNELSDELLNVILTDGNFGRKISSSNKYDGKIRNYIYYIKKGGLFAFIYGILLSFVKVPMAIYNTKNASKLINDGNSRIGCIYRR